MRVSLTKKNLATETGNALLQMAIRIASDGKIDLDEIKELRRWLRSNNEGNTIAAVAYLHDIMQRITADGVVDRDELLELQLAIERVIPVEHRAPVITARKQREAARLARVKEQQRKQQEKDKEERKRLREEEYAKAMRIRHTFAKVAGVSFANDNGSERQSIIKKCKPGEILYLRHDILNEYSSFAIKILRENGEQIGHAPEYLAERICAEVDCGYHAIGLLKDITGGTHDRPTLGVNFGVFFFAPDVPIPELEKYAQAVFDREAIASVQGHNSQA